MERNVGRAGLGKVFNYAVDWRDHKVNVDWLSDAVIAQSLADHRTDSEVGYEVVVHNVEVDDIGTGIQRVAHLHTDLGEVGAED